MKQVTFRETVRHFSRSKDPFLVRRSVKLVVERRNSFQRWQLSALIRIFSGNDPGLLAVPLDAQSATRARVKGFLLFFRVACCWKSDEKQHAQRQASSKKILFHCSLGKRRIFSISRRGPFEPSLSWIRSFTLNTVSPLQSPKRHCSDASRSIVPSLLTFLIWSESSPAPPFSESKRFLTKA